MLFEKIYGQVMRCMPRKEIIAAFLIVSCFIVTTYRNFFAENDIIYYPPAINLASGDIFNSKGKLINLSGGRLLSEDPEVLSLKQEVISPKYVLMATYVLPMKLGFTWEKVRVVHHIIAYFLLALAFLNLCARLKIHNLALCVLFISLGVVNHATSMNIAIYAIYAFTDMSALFISLCLFSISFCFGEKKRYNIALLLASAAALLHPHNGLTAAMVIGLLFSIDCYIDKKIDFTVWKGALVWIIAMAAVSLPNLLTDMNPLPKEMEGAFLQRMTGHTSPAFFIKDKLKAFYLQLFFFLFCVFIAFLRRKKAAVESKTLVRDNLIAIVFPLSYLAVLFLMWLGTDVIKSLTITKLMLSKYFPFVCFVLLVPLLKYFDEKVSEAAGGGGGYLSLYISLVRHVSRQAWCT